MVGPYMLSEIDIPNGKELEFFCFFCCALNELSLGFGARRVQPAVTYPKLTLEALGQGVKSVNNKTLMTSSWCLYF